MKSLNRVKSITAAEIKAGDKVELRISQRRIQVKAVDYTESLSGNYLDYVTVQPTRGKPIIMYPSDLAYLLGE